MKRLFALYFLFFVLCISCNKESDIPNCELGTIRLFNNSTNPYDVWFGANYETRMAGKTTQEFPAVAGVRVSVRVKQVSGYLILPTEKQSALSISGCQTTEWAFP